MTADQIARAAQGLDAKAPPLPTDPTACAADKPSRWCDRPRMIRVLPNGADRVLLFISTSDGLWMYGLHRAAVADLQRQCAELLAGERLQWPKVDAATGGPLDNPLLSEA